LDYLLDNSAAIHLCREIHHMSFHERCQCRLLHLASVFDQLLYHVVAKDISHERNCVFLDFLQNTLFFVAIGRLQLCLNKARAVLIATEFDDMALNVLKDCRKGTGSACVTRQQD
jgi:hypothetical protein